MESMGRLEDDQIVLPQRASSHAPHANSMHQSHQPHQAARARLSRRGTLPRAVEWNQQDAGTIARALGRLGREHVALLWALCELDAESGVDQAVTTTPVMREALRTLIQSDLRRAQHALKRAAEGCYGLCEDCNRPLTARQLVRDPSATRCDACDARVRRTYH